MSYKKSLTDSGKTLDLIQYIKSLLSTSVQKGACAEFDTQDGFKITIKVEKNG